MSTHRARFRSSGCVSVDRDLLPVTKIYDNEIVRRTYRAAASRLVLCCHMDLIAWAWAGSRSPCTSGSRSTGRVTIRPFIFDMLFHFEHCFKAQSLCLMAIFEILECDTFRIGKVRYARYNVANLSNRSHLFLILEQ